MAEEEPVPGDGEIAVRIAASLRMASQLYAMGDLSREAMELLRRSVAEFLAESYRHDFATLPPLFREKTG
ncbi:MAG TPA: hypothetical protein ENJ05_07995 [Thiotrichales bacterium]|nr:hypothetical protein [Thiotrichales bacterium]